MALKVLCHGTKYPLMPTLFSRLILTMPWHKKDFSDLVPGTKNESLGYIKFIYSNIIGLKTVVLYTVIETDKRDVYLKLHVGQCNYYICVHVGI